MLIAGAARGQLTIEITGGGGNQIPVAVLQFAGEAVLPTRITDIIEADLLRSGRFRTQYAGGVNPPPTEPSQVNFGDWKKLFTELQEYDKVTADDVLRVAKTYLIENGRTVAYTKAPVEGGAK